MLRDKIVEFLHEYGIQFKERKRTINSLPCPDCGREDKFSIIKENGSSICYRGSCTYGKQWFPDFMRKVAGISLIEARHRLYGNTLHQNLEVKFDEPKKELEISFEGEEDEIIAWPEDHMMSITSEFAVEGIAYLKKRGVPQEVAVKYGVTFSPRARRVYFPIIMNNKVYGYQGRAIDNVHSSQKVRNNDGFRRDKMVMFLDKVQRGGHVIIAEGPFDALKFDIVGGNVSTMGKIVTDEQIAAINSRNPSRVYMALDDDAAVEMNELVKRFSCPVYRIEVPQSCKARCEAAFDKADFGECTFEEAKQAFLEAYEVDSTSIILHLE